MKKIKLDSGLTLEINENVMDNMELGLIDQILAER